MRHCLTLIGLMLLALSGAGCTAIDSRVSDIAEAQCSGVNLLRGEAYCWRPPAPEPIYCFRTLGTPDCYAALAPFGLTPTPLGQPLPPAVPKS